MSTHPGKSLKLFPSFHAWLAASPFQAAAFGFCFLFGLAMISNIQLGGEATWFWYANLLHHGVHLYADLHLPLQPFYVLETDAWMRLVGTHTMAFESLSVLHVFFFCLGLLLLLGESRWPDWRKAIVFLAAFFVDIFFSAIRFDDFHIVSDVFTLYAVLALLRLYHARAARSELAWAVATGILAGLSFSNRSTDGGMLLIGCAFCIPILARRRKVLSTTVFFAAAAATWLLIVHLTGDTLHAYIENSILHAASAKGGTGTVLRGPFLSVLTTAVSIWHNKGSLWFLLVLAGTALAKRFGKNTPRAVIAAGLLVFAPVLALLVAIHSMRKDLTNGAFIFSFNIIAQNLVYPLCLLVLFHFGRSLYRRRTQSASTWDAREILLLIVGAVLVSGAASQATGTSNSTFCLVLLLLLSSIWLPSAGRFRWLTDSWMAIAIVLAVSGMMYKVRTPYAWNNYQYAAMFTQREVYHHPVYGPMYLQADTLQLYQPFCDTISYNNPHPELLSLPYSYANYFCATPPWHGYVQTWFDTATPDTIHTLMQQLNRSPPQWILYERQLPILIAHENEYNHGRPISHRELDELLMAKLASGQWRLAVFHHELVGDDWYLIQTRR